MCIRDVPACVFAGLNCIKRQNLFLGYNSTVSNCDSGIGSEKDSLDIAIYQF